MINSAEEFKRLRESESKSEYQRAFTEKASIEICYDILKKYPDLAFWVAQNKTIPIEILYILAEHKNAKVRCMVARKRKIDDFILDKLREDPDEAVRYVLICNTNLSNEKKKLIKTSDSVWLEKQLKEIVENTL
ncbi:HEAT repeat domain-containing protein [Aquimarina brevivitae]|uniref:Leucine rich repeat (LRR) protein n=1 Tax=Aquimarina brevivitae TaxID=323412 RepID=A0A4Q7PMJ9_9FLAO|nr:HEAT repeat domain-containing protein [Aquimarina brevivitae]RZT00243.1 hypothetical protein EV197_1479 [Aquimarina brevivitae]